MGKRSNKVKINIDQLAKMFDLPEWTTLEEYNMDNIWERGQSAVDSALEEDPDLSEYSQAEIREKAEACEIECLFHAWHHAVENTVKPLFNKHGLNLVPVSVCGTDRTPYEYHVMPIKDWADVCLNLIETINGVGYFHFNNLTEFLNSGPCTAKEAALSHLHWICRYPEVYGDESSIRTYKRSIDSYIR
jgi:hypothetical protein